MPHIRVALLLVLEQAMGKTFEQIMQDLSHLPNPGNPSVRFLTLRTLKSSYGSVRLAVEGLVGQGLVKRSEVPGQGLQFWLTARGEEEKGKQEKLLNQRALPLGA